MGICTGNKNSVTPPSTETPVTTHPQKVADTQKNATVPSKPSSNADLTLIVEKGSYAENYARENGLSVQYK